MTSIIALRVNNGKQCIVISDRQHTLQGCLLNQSKIKHFNNHIFTACGADNIINEIFTEIQDLNDTKKITEEIKRIIYEKWDEIQNYRTSTENIANGCESIIVNCCDSKMYQISKISKFEIQESFKIIGSGEKYGGIIKSIFPDELYTFEFNNRTEDLFFREIINIFNEISKLDPFTGNIFQFDLDMCVISENRPLQKIKIGYDKKLIEDLDNFKIRKEEVQNVHPYLEKNVVEEKDIVEKKDTVDKNVVEEIKLLVVENKDCSKDVRVFIDNVKSNLIPEMKVERVDFTSKIAQEVISNLDVNQLPIFIFTENISEREDWDELMGSFLEVDIFDTSYYLLNPKFVPNLVLINEPKILEKSIIIGEEDAPVTLIQFVDFECPFTAITWGNEELLLEFRNINKNYVPPIPEIFEKYIKTGKAKLIIYSYPIAQLHPLARMLHKAALAAFNQDKYLEYIQILFERREEWSSEFNYRRNVLFGYAKELKMDIKKFKRDFNSETIEEQISQELQYGVECGVSGTPAFFANKHYISGAQDFDVFEEIIESELSKSKQKK